MPRERLVECVPNFSEGRDPALLRDIAAAMESVPGVFLLDEERDEDHHRAVLTLVGEPEAMVEAAVNAAALAADRIDLRQHRGVHPRIGALDVLPFVPVSGITLNECALLAREAARRIWERCKVPCYLYEAAALLPERRNLENIRKGQFEQLRLAVLEDPALCPDVGGPELHPTAGAIAVGARKFLIAWNVWLRTSDLSVADQIARLIRQSSGGFPFVKALGLPLPRRGLTQVSMNLTDFEETPPQSVFDAIAAEAARHNVEVIGSELIGLVPRRATEVNFRESLRLMNFRSASVLENRLELLRGEERDRIATPAREDNLGQAGSREAKAAHRPAGCQAARRAGGLLLDAVSLAASRPESEPEAARFNWPGEAMECRQLAQRIDELAAAHPLPAGEHLTPAQRMAEALAAIAEKAVVLQTRIASERSRLREDGATNALIATTGAVRQLLSASLNLALVAADELSAELQEPEADAFRTRFQPFWNLAAGN